MIEKKKLLGDPFIFGGMDMNQNNATSKSAAQAGEREIVITRVIVPSAAGQALLRLSMKGRR